MLKNGCSGVCLMGLLTAFDRNSLDGIGLFALRENGKFNKKKTETIGYNLPESEGVVVPAILRSRCVSAIDNGYGKTAVGSTQSDG